MSLSMGVPGRGSGGTRRGRFNGVVRLVAVGLLGLLATGLGGCGGGSGDVGLGFSYPEFPSFPSKAPIRVPQEVATISEAVDSASPGDTILVSPGVYKETVTVRCSDLQIVGTDRDTVILEALPDTGAIAIGSGIQNVRIATMTIRPDPNTPTEPLAEAPRVTSSSQETRENLLARDWPMVDISAIALSQYLAALSENADVFASLRMPDQTLIQTVGDGLTSGVWLESLTVGVLKDGAVDFTAGAHLQGVSGAVVRDCSFQGMSFGLSMRGSSGVVGDCSFSTGTMGILVDEAPQQVTLNQNQVHLPPRASDSAGQIGIAGFLSPIYATGNDVQIKGTQAGYVSGMFYHGSPDVVVSENHIKCSADIVGKSKTNVDGLVLDNVERLEVSENKVEVIGTDRSSTIAGALFYQCEAGAVQRNEITTDCGVEDLETLPIQYSSALWESRLSVSENTCRSGAYGWNILAHQYEGEISKNVFHVPASGIAVDLSDARGTVFENQFLGDELCLSAISVSSLEGACDVDVQSNVVNVPARVGLIFAGSHLEYSCRGNEIELKPFNAQSYPGEISVGIRAALGCQGDITENQISVPGNGDGLGVLIIDSPIELKENIIDAEGLIRAGISVVSDSFSQSVQVLSNSISGPVKRGISCEGILRVVCRDNTLDLRPSGQQPPSLFVVNGISLDTTAPVVCADNNISIKWATDGVGIGAYAPTLDVIGNEIDVEGTISSGMDLWAQATSPDGPSKIQGNRLDLDGALVGLMCDGMDLACSYNQVEIRPPGSGQATAARSGILLLGKGVCSGNQVTLSDGLRQGAGIELYSVNSIVCTDNQVKMSNTMTMADGIKSSGSETRILRNNVSGIGADKPNSYGVTVYGFQTTVQDNVLGQNGPLTCGVNISPVEDWCTATLRGNRIDSEKFGVRSQSGAVLYCLENVLRVVPRDPYMAESLAGIRLDDVAEATIVRNRISSLGDYGIALDQRSSSMWAANNILYGGYLSMAASTAPGGLKPISIVSNNVLAGDFAGIYVASQAPVYGLQVFSNLVLSSLVGLNCEESINSDYNFIASEYPYFGSLPGAHDLFGDPHVLESVEFRLGPGSPCVDSGIDDPDYDDVIPPGLGTVRNDIGAYGGPLAGVIPAETASSDQSGERHLRTTRGSSTGRLPQSGFSLVPEPQTDTRSVRADTGRKYQEARARREQARAAARTQMEAILKSLPRSKRGAL